MAFVDPTLLQGRVDDTTVTDIAAGAGGAAFLAALNARLDLLRDRDEWIAAWLEQLAKALGNGWLSGGAITAGVGLSVSVAAGSAIVGTYTSWNAAETVGGLSASSTNYIWLRSKGSGGAAAAAGSFSSNTSGTAPSGDGLGDALLWGTATTDATTVTAVSNARARAFSPFPKLLYANTASSAAVANTTSETNFDKSYSLPAHSLQPGTVLKIRAAGRYSDTGTPTLQLKLKAGSTTLFDLGAVTLASGVSNKRWAAEFVVVCRAAGASGSVMVTLQSAFIDTGAVSGPGSTVTLDSTAAQVIAVSAQWSAADAANTTILETLTIESVG